MKVERGGRGSVIPKAVVDRGERGAVTHHGVLLIAKVKEVGHELGVNIRVRRDEVL